MEKISYYNELLYNGFSCFEMMTERNLSEAVGYVVSLERCIWMMEMQRIAVVIQR